MPIVGMEGAVGAVRSYLTAALPAKLTALNAEYGDGIVLAAPTAYSIEEEVEIEAFPVVQILGNEQRVLRGAGGHTVVGYDVAIAVSVMDDSDGATLRRRVYRYARAIAELMSASVALAGGLDPAYRPLWDEVMVDYTPAVRSRSTSQVVSGAIVNVMLSRSEAI